MYPATLLIHSWLRWILLLVALAAIVLAFKGWRGDEAWTPLHKRLNTAFVGTMHLELLLGLLLYFVFSPIPKAAMANMGAAMKDPVARFWAVEHITTMILAAVAVTVASVVAKRADTDRAKHKRAAIGFSIALVLTLLAIPWPFRQAGRELFRFALQ